MRSFMAKISTSLSAKFVKQASPLNRHLTLTSSAHFHRFADKNCRLATFPPIFIQNNVLYGRIQYKFTTEGKSTTEAKSTTEGKFTTEEK